MVKSREQVLRRQAPGRPEYRQHCRIQLLCGSIWRKGWHILVSLDTTSMDNPGKRTVTDLPCQYSSETGEPKRAACEAALFTKYFIQVTPSRHRSRNHPYFQLHARSQMHNRARGKPQQTGTVASR